MTISSVVGSNPHVLDYSPEGFEESSSQPSLGQSLSNFQNASPDDSQNYSLKSFWSELNLELSPAAKEVLVVVLCDTSSPTGLYDDYDGDGYGDPNAPSCQGGVENADDCDDADAQLNPEKEEVCDAIDNDCDGLIDADDNDVTDANILYADSDLDSHGDSAYPMSLCGQPAGYVLSADDPEDANSAIYPGAPEILDGFDNYRSKTEKS